MTAFEGCILGIVITAAVLRPLLTYLAGPIVDDWDDDEPAPVRPRRPACDCEVTRHVN